MKRLLFLIVIVLIYSCNTPCLAQIANQIVYTDAFCKAQLPNYVPKVTVTGGCTGFIVTQTPVPGTVLSATNKVVNVTIKATGSNGKSSQVAFTVTLADTITPRITGLTAMVDTLIKKSNALYDIADNMVGEIDKILNSSFPFDSVGLTAVNSYRDKILIIASHADSLGHRQRVMTYADSLIVPFTK